MLFLRTGQTENKYLTEYLQPIVNDQQVQLSADSIAFTAATRKCLSLITGRNTVGEAAMQAIMETLYDE